MPHPLPNPNIVYILADDMGYGDVSALNPRSGIRTPHLDRLAAGGLICRDAHASSAVCTPSRYSILTGRYNWRSVLKQGVTDGESKSIVEPGRMTVASFLRQHGYSTACVGKWHLGWTWPRVAEGDAIDFTAPITMGPTDFGFDTYFGIPASLDMPPYVYVENDRPTATPDRTIAGNDDKLLFREGPIAPDFQPETVLPTFEQKAVEFIDQQQSGKPFFLYLSLNAPHTPILPTIEFRGKSGTNEYGDFCLQVDAVVGRVMEALERNDLADNTILIFTSDNGCSPQADFDELAAVGHQPSYVFRGHKADIYEGGHRIPLIVRWPETITAGSVSDQTVCLSDLLATCADIVGEDLPADTGEDSVSNLPIWRGEPDDVPLRETTVHTSINGSLSIRKGKWKLEMCPGSGGWSFPRPGPETDGLPPCQLYDLDADVAETTNLIDLHPKVAAELKEKLTDIIRRGRSTPGPDQPNSGEFPWQQLWWLAQDKD